MGWSDYTARHLPRSRRGPLPGFACAGANPGTITGIPGILMVILRANTRVFRDHNHGPANSSAVDRAWPAPYNLALPGCARVHRNHVVAGRHAYAMMTADIRGGAWALLGETRVLGMFGRPSTSLNVRCYPLP